MKVFERYFSRNPVSRQLSFEADTAVIVIIPVFNDPDIFATLDSLCCCSVMNIKAGVLIVVNHSEVCPQEIKTRNIGLSDTLKRYVRDRQTDRLRFEVVEAFDLPAKYAGVGLARKIAMDLSAAFFFSAPPCFFAPKRLHFLLKKGIMDAEESKKNCVRADADP